MRTIQSKSNVATKTLFQLGRRQPVLLVEDEPIEELHEHFPGELDTVEFVHVETPTKREMLRTELKLPEFGLSYKEFCQEMEQRHSSSFGGVAAKQDWDEIVEDEVETLLRLCPERSEIVTLEIVASRPGRFVFVDEDHIPDDNDF